MMDKNSSNPDSLDPEASRPQLTRLAGHARSHDNPIQTTSTQSILARLGRKIDSKVVYDAILGLSDGLTVPFALTAGLASLGTTRIVILGGLAELVAGAISMGLGGFIGAQSESESYHTTERECVQLIQQERHEVVDIIDHHFQQYNICQPDRKRMVQTLLDSETDTRSFLMQHHFKTEKPAAARPYMSAVTLGMSYFLGGFVALLPYFCVSTHEVNVALWWSIGIMAVVMFVFGYVKTCVICGWGGRENFIAGLRGAIQMLVVGALAVGAAVGLVKAIEHGGSRALSQ